MKDGGQSSMLNKVNNADFAGDNKNRKDSLKQKHLKWAGKLTGLRCKDKQVAKDHEVVMEAVECMFLYLVGRNRKTMK